MYRASVLALFARAPPGDGCTRWQVLSAFQVHRYVAGAYHYGVVWHVPFAWTVLSEGQSFRADSEHEAVRGDVQHFGGDVSFNGAQGTQFP